jgi:uncharacterized protein (TIGR00266 family)
MMALTLAACATTFDLRDRGSAFASLHVTLGAGDKIKSEPGALVSFSGDLRLDIGTDSSWLGRIFAGEAPYTTSISAASHAGGSCMLVPRTIGDIEILELGPDEGIYLASGSFLAADGSVQIGSEFHGSIARTLFSGTGLRCLVIKGPGVCAFNGHGGLHCCKLAHGEKLSVDNGHVVGWSPGMQPEIGWAAGSGSGSFFRSIASGEGLVCRFEGPGEVWVQTHAAPPSRSGSRSRE